MARSIRRPLVVIAHPSSDSFAHANLAAVCAGFEHAGAHVDVIDLYREGFRSAMSLEERIAYDSDQPILDPQVLDYTERIAAADALVFVYPTWWSSLPAILKGFLERVLVPGVGFRFNPETGRIRPALTNIRRIVGVTTYGSPRTYVAAINDNGRRTLTRTLRLSAGISTRVTWLGLYTINATTEQQRAAFLHSVAAKMARLAGARTPIPDDLGIVAPPDPDPAPTESQS